MQVQQRLPVAEAKPCLSQERPSWRIAPPSTRYRFWPITGWKRLLPFQCMVASPTLQAVVARENALTSAAPP